MRDKLGRLVGAVILMAIGAAIASAALAFTYPAGATVHAPASATSYTPYIPSNIIVGPDSTEFTITDESRPPTVHLICAFTLPKQVGTNSDGTVLYVPTIQCNKDTGP